MATVTEEDLRHAAFNSLSIIMYLVELYEDKDVSKEEFLSKIKPRLEKLHTELESWRCISRTKQVLLTDDNRSKTCKS